jgi:hypothetical protein
MMHIRPLLISAACLLCIGGPAFAAGPADAAARAWHQADLCVADATKQVPDHNAAALQKRDSLVNACLKAHGLPPRNGVAPSDDAAGAQKPAAPATSPHN